MRDFDPSNIPLPTDNSDFIRPEGPLDIEIGCGVGLHPILWSKKDENKNRTLVAIEHTRAKFDKFKTRFENNGKPSNVLPIHANGISWVTHKLNKEEVDCYYFLYPNPNPKASQQNKRFHAMPFMSKVIETLKPGGLIITATNEEFYALEAKEFFTNVWNLKLISFDKITKVDNFNHRTHFEKKYLHRGETCYNMVFAKP